MQIKVSVRNIAQILEAERGAFKKHDKTRRCAEFGVLNLDIVTVVIVKNKNARKHSCISILGDCLTALAAPVIQLLVRSVTAAAVYRYRSHHGVFVEQCTYTV